MEVFLNLLPEEREAVDTFAFAQGLLDKGGDVERRFCLISLDNSYEVVLRAFLLKKGVKREIVEAIRTVDDLFYRCQKAGLVVSNRERASLNEMHNRRNQTYHGKTVMLPTKRDLLAWSKVVSALIHRCTDLDPFLYFQMKSHERISLHPLDVQYLAGVERNFRKNPPHVSRLTWWSEIQRDALEAGEKWDLYVHYRPRWPFFIPTLVLIKCNPLARPASGEYVLDLESKAHFLKVEKKPWRVWLGIISSNGFEDEAVIRAEDHEGKGLGLILFNPKSKKCYHSKRGQCQKALKWLVLG